MAGSLAHFTGEEAEAQGACDSLMIAHQVNGREGRTQASQGTQFCLLGRPRKEGVSPCPLLGTKHLPRRLGASLAAQVQGSWDPGSQIPSSHHHRLDGASARLSFPHLGNEDEEASV